MNRSRVMAQPGIVARALLAGCLALSAATGLSAADRGLATIGVAEAQLAPDYWIDRPRQVNRPILDEQAVALQNARMRQLDPSLHDIEALPVTLEAEQVRGWIEKLSVRPTRTLYDQSGKAGSARALDKLETALSLKSIPQTQVTRYGLIVRRAALRTFPTHLRVFSTPDDEDIDRFQESVLFPGTPVAVVHESRDRRWVFVLSPTYAAWVEAGAVAFGDKADVFAYTRKSPYVVVTGATAHTVFTPEKPAVSNLQLEMGVRVPLADAPADGLVNGQHAGFSHVVELPVRTDEGYLAFETALIPRSADVAGDYLPLTKANLIRQSFKFLGERYGWGHDYNARDCSGFVSEIYRSMGVLLPRNTRDQSVSAGLDRVAFGDGMDHDQRLRLLRQTEVGDLVYIPGHVMMVIGHVDGAPYVIHDTAGMSLRRPGGGIERIKLNGVVVTPLLPMMSDEDTPTVDRITAIQRVRRP